MSPRTTLPVRHPHPSEFAEPWVVWCDRHGVIGVAPTYARARRAAERRERCAGEGCRVRPARTPRLRGMHAAGDEGADV